MNTKETTYVVSVLHIGVHYIMQKGQCLAVNYIPWTQELFMHASASIS